MAIDTGSEGLEQRVDYLESLVGGRESEGLHADLVLSGEAVGIIRRVLDDIVNLAVKEHEAEFADDLDRLATIEALLSHR